MTDTQKALDALVRFAKSNDDNKFHYFDEIANLENTIRAALEAKAVNVELLEALKGLLAGYKGWNAAKLRENAQKAITRAEAGSIK